MTGWPSRLLLDGAMGTELIARGLAAGREAPEAWNVERPGDVRAVYEAYFAAGAHAVQTNTFGGNRVRLLGFGWQTAVRTLNLAGAVLAREVRPTGSFVIGNLGPTGAIPPPEGTADLIELEDAYAEQAMALAEGGVDALHIETMYHPKEARAAIRGAREGAPSLRLIASMTCRRHGTAYTTPLGFSPEVMLAAFLEEGVQGVGANCTLAPADMLDLIRLIRSRTDVAVFAKPTLSPTGTSILPPQELASGALALFAAGAYAVGGCCGAGPDAIRAARQALDRAPVSLDELNVQ
jgi:methionine synthase I (cobalamin-dependent)